MDIVQLKTYASTYHKLAQLAPGASEGDLAGKMISERSAYAKADNWYDQVLRSGRERAVGWSREILRAVLENIRGRENDPLGRAAKEFGHASGADTLEWAVMDAEKHYPDLVPSDQLRAVLEYYLR